MDYKLFNVNEKIEALLEQYMDIETGEISPEAEESLNKLGEERTAMIEAIALSIKNNQAVIGAMETEQDNLQKRINRKKSSTDWLTRFLKRSINEGEKFSTPQFEIKWTTSNRLEIDEITAMPENFVKDKAFKKFINVNTTYKWDKKALTELHKSGKPLLAGMNYITTKNIKVS